MLGENLEGRMKLFEVLVRIRKSTGKVFEMVPAGGSSADTCGEEEDGDGKNCGEGGSKGSKFRREVKGTGRRVEEGLC